MSAFYVPVRRVVYLTVGAVEALLPKDKNQIVIFCYHSISDGGWDFSVTKKMFEQQINYLAKHYTFLSMAELASYLTGGKELVRPGVIITFDDGYQDVLQIKDFLKEKGVKPCVFVIADRKKASRKELDNKLAFLTTAEIMELVNAGWEVGSHTSTHTDMAKLTKRQTQEEVVNSKARLEEELGVKVNYIAYPKGRYNMQILSAAKMAGYCLGLSMDDGTITRETDRLTVPRVGVDGTHSFGEFKVLANRGVSQVRKLMRTTLVKD